MYLITSYFVRLCLCLPFKFLLGLFSITWQTYILLLSLEYLLLFTTVLFKSYVLDYLLSCCYIHYWKWNVEVSWYYFSFYLSLQFCQSLYHIFRSFDVWCIIIFHCYIFLWINTFNWKKFFISCNFFLLT